jgi:nucleoside-diphosphate-sugar epimerase
MRAPGLYGSTKYLGEAMLAEHAAFLPSVCLRLPGVIGPGAARNWLSGIRAAACQGQPIPYYGGDAAFNNAVHIEDLGSLILELLRRPLRGFDMVTLGAAGAIAVRRVVDLVIAETGGRARAEELADRRPTFVISSARARERYDYDPMDIETMVRRFAAGG